MILKFTAASRCFNCLLVESTWRRASWCTQHSLATLLKFTSNLHNTWFVRTSLKKANGHLIIVGNSMPKRKHVSTYCVFHWFHGYKKRSNFELHKSLKFVCSIVCAQAQVSLFRRCSHWSLQGVCAAKAWHKRSLYPGLMVSDWWNARRKRELKNQSACDAHITVSSSQSLWGSIRATKVATLRISVSLRILQASELPWHPQNVHRFRFYTLVVWHCVGVLYIYIHIWYVIKLVKGNFMSFMEETPSHGWFYSHQPKDLCVQFTRALSDHEVTFSLA